MAYWLADGWPPPDVACPTFCRVCPTFCEACPTFCSKGAGFAAESGTWSGVAGHTGGLFLHRRRMSAVVHSRRGSGIRCVWQSPRMTGCHTARNFPAASDRISASITRPLSESRARDCAAETCEHRSMASARTPQSKAQPICVPCAVSTRRDCSQGSSSAMRPRWPCTLFPCRSGRTGRDCMSPRIVQLENLAPAGSSDTGCS